MRKRLLALFAAGALAAGMSPAFAQPPEEDPTCGRGTQSGSDCAGDNGAAGLEGLCRDEVPDNPGTDLARDILGEGPVFDCDE